MFEWLLCLFLTFFIPFEVKQSRFYDELPKRLSDIVDCKISPLQDNLLKVGNDALKLNVPPAVMREAVYRLNNEKTDKLAESYEKLYERKNSPDREQPERDEPAVHKKPKLWYTVAADDSIEFDTIVGFFAKYMLHFFKICAII